MTAVLAGATGLVGKPCLRLLLAEPHYEKVVVLARRPTGLRHAKLEERIIDFERLSEIEPIPEADLYCALGTTIRKAGSPAAFRHIDYDYTLAFASWGLCAGASRCALVSSVGADPDSSNFYLRTKGETERDVAKLGWTAFHILRPSLLVGKRAEHRTGELLAGAVMRLLQGGFLGPLRRYHPIPAEWVAQAMVNAMRSPQTGVQRYEYNAMLALLDRSARGLTV